MKLVVKCVLVLNILLLCSVLESRADEPFVVVELFTSEGCSSCPPADAVLSQLTKEAAKANSRVYTLSFHVDYWDYLGWKDPFSNPEFTKRQYRYAKALKATSAYTPQMIINGQQVFVGSEIDRARRFIEIYSEIPAANTLTLQILKNDEKQIEISYACNRINGDDQIHFALVESGLENKVTAGENNGRTLKNDQVVRQFKSVPLKREGTVQFDELSADRKGPYAIIAFVQGQKNMRIYAANKIDLN